MRIGSLFSGIGGLELGLEMSGLGRAMWQVEQSEYCREVLARHWPDAERFDNVETVGRATLAPVDLICGGFPCQDISSAGKGAGLSGSRSGLWFEYARIIEELGPEWVVIENVASGAKRWVDQVSEHLGELGYETLPIPISASDVGAPHRRARVFLVAHSERVQLREQQGRGEREGRERAPESGHDGEAGNATDANLPQRERNRGALGNEQTLTRARDASERGVAALSAWPAPPELRRVDDGVPDRAQRLKALGNAVVPQCAEVIGHIIQELSK